MTFRGNLLLYSLWYELHPFENLRRKGITATAWRTCPGQNAKVFDVCGKKFCGLFISPWTASAAGCGCISPRRQGLIRVCDTRQAMSRNPPQRRRARARNGVAPYIPASCCRNAGSAGHGATEAARPERSLQAGVFMHRTVAAARNRASGFGGDRRVRQQLPVGVGPDDRMPPGSREPKVQPADRTTLQKSESEQQIKEQHHHQEQCHNLRKKHS